MKSRIIMIILLAAFLIAGCASVERRAHKIQSKYRHWDKATVEKVAAKKVEIGMTHQMVHEALGRPDRISFVGDEEKWTYGVNREYGQGAIYRELVYFVYFKEGKVVKTAGNSSRLGYWFYR